MQGFERMHAYLLMAVLRGEHEGGEALVLLRLDVGLCLEQEEGHLLVILYFCNA